jgi:hypothetical protein
MLYAFFNPHLSSLCLQPQGLSPSKAAPPTGCFSPSAWGQSFVTNEGGLLFYLSLNWRLKDQLEASREADEPETSGSK